MVRKIRIQWEEDDATDDEMDKTSMSKEAMIDHEGTEDEIESEDSEEISRTTEELGRDEPVTQEFDHTEEETEVKEEEEEEDYGIEKEESNDEIEDETQDLETLEPVDNIEEEDVIAEAFSKNDVRYAKDLVRNITDYVSNYEKKALASGFRPQGPPRDYPLSIKGQFKRKFRWPVQIRNVINKEFELDSDEEDFLCEDLCINRDTNESNAFTKLSKVSRPSMQTVIDALPSQKRKRPTQKEDKNEEKADEVEDEGNKETNLHKHELRTLARLGDQFSDDFLDSLLKKNLMGLQGLDESLSQSCWIPLPTSQRPIANWRFVLETLARTPASLTGSSLPLRLSTLENIKNRLFRLYANPHHLVQNQHLSRLVQAYQDPYDVNDSVNNVHSF